MDASMWVAKTGLDAQQTRLTVISNNLANVNTTGFKRDRAMFEDLLYQNVRQAGGQTAAANAASITIGLDGVVSAELYAGGGAQQLGQIQIARFVNPAGLTPLGDNLYKETIASGAAVVLNPNTAPAGQLRQGMLEASNVNVVEEMVNMIETQRAYEVNSKAISAADGMLRFLNNNL